MFSVNAPLLIAGGIFQQFNNVDHRTFLIEAFRNHVAHGASHDTAAPGDPPSCHPKTRLTILRQLSTWVRSDDPNSPFLLWIFGPAGVGKTAIGRSLAEILAQNDRLAASFFFFRTDGQRNSGDHLVSTLAYQLAFKFPELQPCIADYIRDNPHTAFSLSIETQLEQLIVAPMLQNMEWKHQRLIIVDGLDECHDHDMQSRILLALGDIAFQLAGKLKFLILSRPEYHIEVTFQSFRSGLHSTCFKSMDLKLDLNALDDIRIFTMEQFDAIKKKHPLRAKIPPCWPDSADIEKLVWRSSGNFIYPKTVMKYIQTTCGRPDSRLQVILALKPTHDRPYGDLDNLYCHILKTVRADIKMVLKVLGVFHVLNSSTNESEPRDRSAECVEAILSLQAGDIELLLLDLRSLVDLEEKQIFPRLNGPALSPSPRILRFLHASFSEYLLDHARSQEFWIDLSKSRMTTVIGVAKAIKQQRLSSYGVFQLFLALLKQKKSDELFTQMVNDEDIAISDIAFVSAALVEVPYNHGLCRARYYSLSQSLLKKYHNQDPFVDNILAILFVIPHGDQGVVTIMKCIACILLFHPSSNVSPLGIEELARTYSSSYREENNWYTAFTYLQETANGSASSALKFMTGAALLPAEPRDSIAHAFTNGFFARFLRSNTVDYQMTEEILQMATLFCLSSFSSSRCQDIRYALLDSAHNLKDHLNNMLYLITRLLLIQLYDQRRTYQLHSSSRHDLHEWYRPPKRIEMYESALELRKYLTSVLETLERPVDVTLSTRIMQNFVTIAQAFVLVSDKNGPVQNGAGTNYGSIPCLVCPGLMKDDLRQDTGDWTIKPLATILNEEFMYSTIL